MFILIWLTYLLKFVRGDCANVIQNTTSASCDPDYGTICGWLSNSSDATNTTDGTAAGSAVSTTYTCGCVDVNQNANLWHAETGTNNETCPVNPTIANSPGTLWVNDCPVELLQCNAPVYCSLPKGITDPNSTSCPSTGSLSLLASLGVYNLVGAAVSLVFGTHVASPSALLVDRIAQTTADAAALQGTKQSGIASPSYLVSGPTAMTGRPGPASYLS